MTEPAEDQYPRFWMNEVTGVLRPAIEAYLYGHDMTQFQIAAMRAYLRQWIDAPVWQGPEIVELRRSARRLTSRHEISQWIDAAMDAGIDPL